MILIIGNFIEIIYATKHIYIIVDSIPHSRGITFHHLRRLLCGYQSKILF